MQDFSCSTFSRINQLGNIIHRTYQITDILGKGSIVMTDRAIYLETQSFTAIEVISFKLDFLNSIDIEKALSID